MPAKAHQTTFSHRQANQPGAPSVPGLHDTLRSGVGPSSLPTVDPKTSATTQPLASAHPLEARLARWQATQHALQMEGLRRTFGMAEPVRRAMELKIVRDSEWRPAALGGTGGSRGMVGMHEDILLGRDTRIGWEDVFTGDETRPIPGIHEEMERKLKM